MSERQIPPGVIRSQAAASDPSVSAFVAANAGSGKTYVLVQRVIRLLLEGADPAKILCLTFTKAAAANMARGVFGTLSKWTACDDATLDEQLRLLDGGQVTASRRRRARRLFAQALETPGGLKVQTIHALCTRLLQQFPFEANVAARFTVLDERTEEELIDTLRLHVLLDAAGDPESTLGRALATSVAAAADTTFAEALRAAVARRDAITDWIARAGGIEAAGAELSRTLGLSPGDDETNIEAEIFSSSLLRAPDLDDVRAAIGAGSKRDRVLLDRIDIAARAREAERVPAYLQIFFTAGDLSPRKSILTKPTATAHPALAERLSAEQARLAPLIDRWRAVPIRDRTLALLTLASAVIAGYQAEKRRRGLLDYDDLISKTRELLRDVGAAWVHYKLDLGVDHVLIDEAQDTSPEQWDIIRALVSEFTAGAGARATRRSIFAVGDEKQSIYSFQGAEPRMFADMRRHFQQAHDASAIDFRACRFDFSFRSGANVLAAVDAVFADRRIGMSITDDEAGAPRHEPLPDAPAGTVHLWPLVAPDPQAKGEGWDAPFDAQPRTSPTVRLARRIAATIKAWQARGECFESGEPVRAGDILVLVRQRGPLFEAVIRALKDADIPVAGADRLVLTEHIAIMDLLALADALLCPKDDLALATVLKSPLFGLTEEEIFTLAWNRKGTLREALRAHAREPALASVLERLARLETEARRLTPFAFFGKLLGSGGGRARFLARLGFEAADALDEFLALALTYDARETPTVQGFAAWMRAASTEIKRDMEIGRDEVRVMTAHGAKGLEAPIVFVVDTTTPPAGAHPPKLLHLPAEHAPPDTPDRIVWAGSQKNDCVSVAAARARARRAAEDEYRRLLYVALTRAKERLIVCGARGPKEPPEGCWYELVEAALKAGYVEEPAPYGEGVVYGWCKTPPRPGLLAPRPPSLEGSALPPPNWLVPLPPRAATAERITPSAAAPFRRGGGEGEPGARLRGRLVHRLMQSLPELSPARRAEAASQYLARAGAELTPVQRDALAAAVLRVLDDSRFRPLFAPGSRAEAPVVGRLRGVGRDIRISGQIDRLAVTDSRVLIVDYKTDRVVPRDAQSAPAAYLVQMALYAALLRDIYPDRELEAALLWMQAPVLMDIPPSLLAEALHHHGVSAA